MNKHLTRFSALLSIIALATSAFATAVPPVYAATSPAYDIGSPTLNELWVNPTGGNDANAGTSRSAALRTIDEAWSRVPQGSNLTRGYRINLVAGTYPTSGSPNYWESRYGTASAPIIIQAADGNGTASIPSMNVFDTRYIYIIGINMAAGGGDVFHCEKCDHLLLRNDTITGTGNRAANDSPQETIKINQSTNVYIEDSNISGAWDNAIDFVSVQGGHVINNKIHDANDWCEYTKGGSANFRIEGNEYYNCGVGGFTAGQGTGFEFMSSPYLHYEAYDIKFINNVIHDTQGAAFGVNGGYNILMAYNTAYRVGTTSHVVEIGFGLRGCDGNTAECQARLNAGGWGTSQTNDGNNEQPIPNRNVFILNNVIYNPAGTQSQWQHFQIAGPRTPRNDSHIATPSRSDTNLVIKGNVIWNGPADHSLGIDADSGCQDSNSTCNAAQLTRDNAINTIQPQLMNPAGGDYRPVASGNLFTATAFAIPNFAGGDRPTPPSTPAGDLSNVVGRDRAGNTRPLPAPAGAYSGSSSAAPTTPVTSPPPPSPTPDPGNQTPPPTSPTVPFSPSAPSPTSPPPGSSNNPSSQAIAAGTLIKLPDDANISTTVDAVVYYVGSDNKRHGFPNERVYFSWYPSFTGVRVISASEMAALPLGPIVTYRPGVRLVKFQTDPKTYAIARGGELRWIINETVARAIYGSAWNRIIDDFSDAFFTDYHYGADITSASGYSASSATAGTTTIDQNQGR